MSLEFVGVKVILEGEISEKKWYIFLLEQAAKMGRNPADLDFSFAVNGVIH